MEDDRNLVVLVNGFQPSAFHLIPTLIVDLIVIGPVLLAFEKQQIRVAYLKIAAVRVQINLIAFMVNASCALDVNYPVALLPLISLTTRNATISNGNTSSPFDE